MAYGTSCFLFLCFGLVRHEFVFMFSSSLWFLFCCLKFEFCCLFFFVSSVVWVLNFVVWFSVVTRWIYWVGFVMSLWSQMFILLSWCLICLVFLLSVDFCWPEVLSQLLLLFGLVICGCCLIVLKLFDFLMLYTLHWMLFLVWCLTVYMCQMIFSVWLLVTLCSLEYTWAKNPSDN